MARVAAVAPDLFFASKIEATLSAAGHEVTMLTEPDAAALAAADIVIVDLTAVDPGALPRNAVPVLGFYPHVDAALRERAEAAGIDLVVPRSRMAREMPHLVDALTGGQSQGRADTGDEEVGSP